MASAVVEIVDGFVGHEVSIVKEESVKTQSIGKLEVLGGVPLVLCIDAGLVEGYSCLGVVVASIAVGQAYHLGCSSVDEVIHAAIAVVAGTVTHVLVVGHLVLVGYSAGDLMTAGGVDELVLEVEDIVVHGIVVAEQLVAQRHILGVGVRAVLDVDEGELGRVTASHIVYLGECGEELIGQTVAQTCVQVQ